MIKANLNFCKPVIGFVHDGLEISKAIGMNRVTLSKYLGILFAEGIIGQKHVGNAIVWFVQEGTDSFSFPDDYDTAAKKYLDLLLANSVNATPCNTQLLAHGGSTRKNNYRNIASSF